MSNKQFKIRNLVRNVKGFTLTEVMIGMMILTVAIVSASNLLTGIISSNQNNLTTLQAYYLSQEGLEIVRNIRDTNWLHNRDWLGKGSVEIWGEKFEISDVKDSEGNYVGKEYVVEVVDVVGASSFANKDSDGTNIGSVASESPWRVKSMDSNPDVQIYGHGDYLDSLGASYDGVPSGFSRKIFIKKYDCEYLKSAGLCEDENAYVLVQSKVEWNLGAKKRELVLSEVVSNWKGGAL